MEKSSVWGQSSSLSWVLSQERRSKGSLEVTCRWSLLCMSLWSCRGPTHQLWVRIWPPFVKYGVTVDLQSSFGLHVTWLAWLLIGWDPARKPPLPPHLDTYKRALLVSQDKIDDISLWPPDDLPIVFAQCTQCTLHSVTFILTKRLYYTSICPYSLFQEKI